MLFTTVQLEIFVTVTTGIFPNLFDSPSQTSSAVSFPAAEVPKMYDDCVHELNNRIQGITLLIFFFAITIEKVSIDYYRSTSLIKLVTMSSDNKKRKIEQSGGAVSSSTVSNKKVKPALKEVWIAFHQLEASYHCVGDWGPNGKYLSHRPKTFDAKILGVFTKREAANRCAKQKALDLGMYEDSANYFNDDCGDVYEDDKEDEENEDADQEPEDFVGKGKFRDGAASGDVNTFSERVFVKKHIISE